MKTIRLAETAENRLTEIIDFTIERFGVMQARRYQEQLANCLKHLGSGKPPRGRSCARLGASDSSNLSYYRQGMHYVIYQEDDEFLTVYDFVHVSRNLPELLAKLESGDLE